MQSVLLFTIILFFSVQGFAQEIILKPSYLKYPMDSSSIVNFESSLEKLFQGITQGEVIDSLLTKKRSQLTKTQLKKLAIYEANKDSSTTDIQDKQLINIYPISENEYSLSISYFIFKDSIPIPIYIIHLIANKKSGYFTFSIPLDYITRRWHSQEIGNITYYFRGEINEGRAKQFNQKNTLIANKLGLEPEELHFYICENYQEIQALLSFTYSAYSNGVYRDGYGVSDRTIFSVMNHEDFSHDIFHYYSGKINQRQNRNWITEEAFAYTWGNAYYTDSMGEMISHQRLVGELKKYLAENPEVSLFQLFENNPSIFTQIAPEASIRSTIAGLIANEVEKQKGQDGVLALINAGREDSLESFLKATNQLLGIHAGNFNSKVGELLKNATITK